jgi:hypothetical protein
VTPIEGVKNPIQDEEGGPCQNPTIPWQRGQPARPDAGDPPALPGFLAETGDFAMTLNEEAQRRQQQESTEQ